MRVNRALEKLHRYFIKRGVVSTTVLLAGVISANSVHAAPSVLIHSITVVAVANGAASSGSTLSLAKGALKLMAWTKAKTAIVAGVAVILAAGTPVVVHVVHVVFRNIYSHGRRDANSHRAIYGQGPAVQGAAAKGNARIRENVSGEGVVGTKSQG